MKQRQFFSHLAAFACGVLLVCGVSMTAPQRVSSGVYGDVNGDGTVDIDDLNEVVNVILGKPHGGATTKTYTVGGVSFKMVAVAGGTFTMGATAEQGDDAYSGGEYPTHQVTLSSYSIGETEVTQALWQAVMGSNPSRFNGSREEYDYYSGQYVTVNYGTNLQRPVECVSWDDCQTFLTKLNQLTGETFRLPTEAEWEYAARGGSKSQGYKYAGSNDIDEVCWYWDNIPSRSYGTSGYGTQTVATKSPNELGLYDMSGNVLEWCQDWYGSYSSGAQTNPTGSTSGSVRVNRGGSWGLDARGCRVSTRSGLTPSYADYDRLGLRLAL